MPGLTEQEKYNLWVAAEVGLFTQGINPGTEYTEMLLEFARRVASNERMQCLSVCEEEADEHGTDSDGWYAARWCAAKIAHRDSL